MKRLDNALVRVLRDALGGISFEKKKNNKSFNHA